MSDTVGRSGVASTRAAQTSAHVISAAVQVLADTGWSGFSLGSVARVAGVSHKAVKLRAPDPDLLAAMAWREEMGPALAAAIDSLRTALNQAQADDSPAALVSALNSFVSTDLRSRATVEALVMARFVPPLRTAVEDDFGVIVRDWLMTNAGDDPVAAAQAAYLLAIAIGLLLTAHYPMAGGNLNDALRRHADAVLHPTAPAEVPDRPARHLDDYPELAPGDPALDILLNQALELMGTRGFDRVTVMEIAAAAGVTEGMVFHRYPTKMALLVDATRRQHAAGWQLNHDYVQALAQEFPTGIADAIHIREYLRPGREMGRSMLLEQLRLGRHHPDLMAGTLEAIDEFLADLSEKDRVPANGSDFHVTEARDVGLCALPMLAPDCWRLPYDAVTVPLRQGV